MFWVAVKEKVYGSHGAPDVVVFVVGRGLNVLAQCGCKLARLVPTPKVHSPVHQRTPVRPLEPIGVVQLDPLAAPVRASFGRDDVGVPCPRAVHGAGQGADAVPVDAVIGGRDVQAVVPAVEDDDPFLEVAGREAEPRVRLGENRA